MLEELDYSYERWDKDLTISIFKTQNWRLLDSVPL